MLNKKKIPRPAGRTFDGVSRPSTDNYRQRWDEIFGKKKKKLKKKELKNDLQTLT